MSWARANWTFIRPRTPMPSASLSVDARTRSSSSGPERHRRQHAGRVAGVDAGLLDVLHDPAEVHLRRRRRARRRRSRSRRRGTGRPAPGARARRRWPGRRSRRASRRRRRSPCRGRRARRTGAPARGSRSRGRPRPPPSALYAVPWRGAGSPASASTRPKAPRSSARWIASGEVPTIGTPSSLSAWASPSGVWPPSWTMTPAIGPGLPLGVDDLEHVLERERLEVQPAGGVVVGGDRLGVAVDHHRVEAGVAQREAGVHAGVVELDALADPVRARSRG